MVKIQKPHKNRTKHVLEMHQILKDTSTVLVGEQLVLVRGHDHTEVPDKMPPPEVPTSGPVHHVVLWSSCLVLLN